MCSIHVRATYEHTDLGEISRDDPERLSGARVARGQCLHARARATALYKIH